MRTVAPNPEEIEALRRQHGLFHERKFVFDEPGEREAPFPARATFVRGWVICVPVDIYRQAVLVRKVGAEDWFFPGGGIEPNETVDEAAERELMEETGMQAESGVLKALWWWTLNYKDGPATLAHFVYLQTVVGEPEVQDTKEIAEVRAFRDPPTTGLYHTLIHDALADTGMLHQWGIDFEQEQKFGTG